MPDLGKRRPSDRIFTRSEVAKHNTRNDCWIIDNGAVFNVTSWIDAHPGQNALLVVQLTPNILLYNSDL
jgi:cytochrome b involved in lipid metabolism